MIQLYFSAILLLSHDSSCAKNHMLLVDPVKLWLTDVDILGKRASSFVHPVKGDGNAALHLCSGDLGQVLGVEDEEVSWSLGAGGHHDGQQHSWGPARRVIT